MRIRSAHMTVQKLSQRWFDVSGETEVLYRKLDELADDDASQMGVELILFWPALFALEGGDGPEAHEYAKLRGKFNFNP